MDLLTVRIDSPENLIWEGGAKSVSSTNSEGPFDILPQHAGFISLIEKKPIMIVTEDGKHLKFEYDRCVIYNQNNRVSIYTL